MADVIIKGMEMPTDGRITIQIGADGAVYFVEKCRIMAEKYEKSSHAAPLPEKHGRLIDGDALMNNIGDVPYKGAVRRVLMSAPTIIEADLEWKMKNCCCFSNTDQAEGGTEDGN